MSDFNIQFEENDQHITLDFKEAIGTVQSVNGKIGDVVLDPGDLEYDDTETYSSGSVGDELSTVKDGLSSMQTATASDVGKALKAKTVSGGKVTEWEFGEAGGGLSEDVKQALLQIAEKVAYIDGQGQDYYDALESALYPPVDLVSISAVYTQSGTVYDTDALDSLKSDLTVTATYSDSSTATVTEYTLSGTLTVGTSTITVSYGGKTATFNVTVTAVPTLSSISAVYTQSGTVYETDSLDSLKDDLVVTAHMSDSTTQTVTDYVLSGTLTAGTSTITVSYGGKTATFNVTVTERAAINVTYTQGSIGGKNTDANRVSGVITSDVHFDDGESMVISVESGYSIYPFGYAPNDNPNNAGTQSSTNVLNAYVVSDSSYVVPDLINMHGTLYAGTKLLNNKGDAGWMTGTITYTFTKTDQYGYTFTGLGFGVKKNDNANITPSDIEPLITINKVEA